MEFENSTQTQPLPAEPITETVETTKANELEAFMNKYGDLLEQRNEAYAALDNAVKMIESVQNSELMKELHKECKHKYEVYNIYSTNGSSIKSYGYGKLKYYPDNWGKRFVNKFVRCELCEVSSYDESITGTHDVCRTYPRYLEECIDVLVPDVPGSTHSIKPYSREGKLSL